MRDHKLREILINDRTLEAHYGGFVLSQARKVPTKPDDWRSMCGMAVPDKRGRLQVTRRESTSSGRNRRLTTSMGAPPLS